MIQVTKILPMAAPHRGMGREGGPGKTPGCSYRDFGKGDQRDPERSLGVSKTGTRERYADIKTRLVIVQHYRGKDSSLPMRESLIKRD
jgi:hypothetical protein